MLLSVILPTYNEADNIVPLIKALQTVLKRPYELIVVDDNSPDGTSKRVATYIQSNASLRHTVRLETRTHNHGLTNSIQHGIEKAKGDVIVWMDCDFSHPPETIPLLLAQVQSCADIAVASRFIAGGRVKEIERTNKNVILPAPRSLGVRGNEVKDPAGFQKPGEHIDGNESEVAVMLSTLMNKSLNLLFQMNFHDFTSGFIAIKKEVLADLLPLQGDYGEYFIDLMVRAKRKGYTVTEVAYSSPPRRAGVSKTAPTLGHLFQHGMGYLTTIIRLLMRS